MPHIGEKAELIGNKGAGMSITPGASPYAYTALANGSVIVSGGTVTVVEYGRAASFYLVGLIAGTFRVLAGDKIRVTYAIAPTMTFVPD